MNNAQLKYVKERLSSARDNKLNGLPRRYSFSEAQKDELYKDGKFTVEKYGRDYRIVWEGEAEWVAEGNKERQTLNEQYQKILDEIMLGDDELAIQLINKFIGE